MHRLRTSTLIARLVLAWFVLALGVAAAAPAVQPKAMELVCTASGGILMVVNSDDAQTAPPGQHTLDCALCLNALAPMAWVIATPRSQQPLARALNPIVAAHIAARTGAPLPPRGPPQPG